MFYNETGRVFSFEKTSKNFETAIDCLFTTNEEYAAIFNVYLKQNLPSKWNAKKAENFCHLLGLCYFQYATNPNKMNFSDLRQIKDQIDPLLADAIEDEKKKQENLVQLQNESIARRKETEKAIEATKLRLKKYA